MAKIFARKGGPAVTRRAEDDETDYERPHQRQVNARAIAEAAYFRWLKRGSPHGDDKADWYAAERRLRKTSGE